MKIIVVPSPNETWTERFKRKAQAKWREVKDSGRKTREWLDQNKEMVIVLAPVVITAAAKIGSSVGKHINLCKEERLKELRWYDTRTGRTWHIRRVLTSDESLIVERRFRNGESLGEIFESMKVLK